MDTSNRCMVVGVGDHALDEISVRLTPGSSPALVKMPKKYEYYFMM